MGSTPPDVAVVLGTYNRFGSLRRAVESCRRAARATTLRVLVADGGSTDGTREWLADQADCELLEGGLAGAVKAFNVGFARAVVLGSPYVCQFNDDIAFTAGGELDQAVAILVASPGVGAVAFASDRMGPEPGFYDGMRCHGKSFCNQGVFRREAGMAAARALGDPSGKLWWDPQFHTYYADTALGLMVWRLGWTILEAESLAVTDSRLDGGDALRDRNVNPDNLILRANVTAFQRRWGDKRSSEYCRADAERFGGLLR